MTIKDPCSFCATAYGHKFKCPHQDMFMNVPIAQRADAILQAQQEWKRGYDDAAKEVPVHREDRLNEVYMLGRGYHELEISGRVPRRKSRPVRIPAKSEPRMTAVSAAIRADT